ncbi:MAG: DNA primase, partial [Candidatus Omnitrophota bacterium]
GNAFGFLMQYERLEFPEAVETLAKKAGVALPQPEATDTKTANFITQLYKVNELTSLFYEGVLNSPSGAAAKNYLIKRGLKEETIKTFKLGFAPDKWDSLINELRQKDFSLGLLEKAGLVLSKDGGGFYDRFRNRIIFPISDIKARVLGFGARVLPAPSAASGDESLPKYINSPETPIYTKGRNLYGLHLAKDAIREEDAVVVVEGYLDFIMPYQGGMKNIVASQGTALTQEQARALKRFTQNVVMVYDPDKAGELAALRSLDIFIEQDISVKVVTLPQGADPDLFVRKNGIAQFHSRVKEAQNLFDYKLQVLKTRYNAKEIEGKAKISGEMLSTVNKFKNAVLKSEYIKRLAEQLSVKEEALLAEAAKIKDDKSYAFLSPVPSKAALNINPTERLLVKLMLEENELINHIKESLEPADFRDERIGRIISIMFELIDQGKAIEPQKLANYFQGDEALQVICESSFLPEVSGEDRGKIVDDCIQRLKAQRHKTKRQQLHDEISQAQAKGDEVRLKSLMHEFHALIKKG